MDLTRRTFLEEALTTQALARSRNPVHYGPLQRQVRNLFLLAEPQPGRVAQAGAHRRDFEGARRTRSVSSRQRLS